MTKPSPTADKAIDFKSATLDTVRLVLHSQNTDALLEQLQQHLEQSAGFFAGEPVVIDATALEAGIDWPRLQQCLLAHELHPIGVVAKGAAAHSAEAAGLALVELSVPSARTRRPEQPHADAANQTATGDQAAANASPQAAKTATQVEADLAAAQETTNTSAPTSTKQAVPADADAQSVTPTNSGRQPTKIVHRQLRSGQRIYAQNSDLVVIGVVGHGAEIIADGHIHVYGPLRGRAMAGANGNTQARIFTTELDPELIAIAGVYKVIEEALSPEQRHQAAIISLDGESLKIESIR